MQYSVYPYGYRQRSWRVAVECTPNWFERVILRRQRQRCVYYGSGNVWRAVDNKTPAPGHISRLCTQAIKDRQ